MLTRPDGANKKDIQKHKAAHHHNRYQEHQHGHVQQYSLLLDLPAESLTYITSSLDPPSLLSLSRTNKRLYEHVKDDSTWFRAFLNQFLGIDPESDLHHVKLLCLRRLENTWRKEMINRHKLKRRWERSRNGTVTHTPLDSTVSSVHLMSESGLLAASIQYGVVARSLPLTGKILKGYIGASQAGLGIGNPNVEFTPNISTCAMTSDGGTARIFWGYRNGDVAVTTASKAMDSTRAAARLLRCGVVDQHEGAVQEIMPNSATGTFLTAASDGRVKLWDIKTVGCLWTSDQQKDSLVIDPYHKVAGSLIDGIVVGALKSGDIYVWTGLNPSQENPSDLPLIPSNDLRIPTPLLSKQQPQGPYSNTPEVEAIFVAQGTSPISILVSYADHTLFYRLRVGFDPETVEVTHFGDPSLGIITAIKPIFTTVANEFSFVVVGDQLGCISIYDWNAPHSSQPVCAIDTFEAHEDGAITSIAWTPIAFATGSTRGTVKVWDSLTFQVLRLFSSPMSRPPQGRDWECVSQIILEKELIVISVGSSVMVWKLGSPHHNGQKKKKNKASGSSKKSSILKGQQRFELVKDISESRRELEDEQAHVKRAYGRRREQHSTLENLGLSEAEAVEYMLMLSRDEEEKRRRSYAGSHQALFDDEGVFEADFNDLSLSPLSGPSTSLPPPRSSAGSVYHGGRPLTRVAIPISNEKVQTSPPFKPEPMEAGPSISPINSAGLSSKSSPVVMHTTSSSEHFPPISSSMSSTASTPGGRKSTYHSVSNSPKSYRLSRGGSPISSLPRSSSSTNSTWGKAPVIHPAAFEFSSSADIARHPNEDTPSGSSVDMETPAFDDDMDDDLRFALELSLVEARSREEMSN